eukprot:7815633-Alexandrium_andersonii.AAC.1
MVVARLGPTDGVLDDVSKFAVPLSRVAPGTVWRGRAVSQEHVNVPGEGCFPERTMSSWKKVA